MLDMVNPATVGRRCHMAKKRDAEEPGTRGAQTAGGRTIEEKAGQQRAKLRELYDMRMPKTLVAIARVGNLSRYNPTPEQAALIVKTLEGAVQSVKAQFSGEKLSRQAPALPEMIGYAINRLIRLHLDAEREIVKVPISDVDQRRIQLNIQRLNIEIELATLELDRAGESEGRK